MRYSTPFKIVAAFAVTASLSVAASAHNTGYHHQHQSGNSDQLIGAGIGAVIGGVAGSQLAGNGARTEGSVLGAVIGGVAGAAIAGDGRSNNRGYYQGGYNQGGYYNQQTGYYHGGGYNQGGYYQGNTTYHYPQGHSQYGYSQPYYNQGHHTTYTTTYQQPFYRYDPQPYYVRPRTGISISLNTGNRGYYNRGYRTRGHYRNRNRGHNRRNYRRRH
jgi:uncharacterized protein YcfJ